MLGILQSVGRVSFLQSTSFKDNRMTVSSNRSSSYSTSFKVSASLSRFVLVLFFVKTVVSFVVERTCILLFWNLIRTSSSDMTGHNMVTRWAHRSMFVYCSILKRLMPFFNRYHFISRSDPQCGSFARRSPSYCCRFTSSAGLICFGKDEIVWSMLGIGANIQLFSKATHQIGPKFTRVEFWGPFWTYCVDHWSSDAGWWCLWNVAKSPRKGNSSKIDRFCFDGD